MFKPQVVVQLAGKMLLNTEVARPLAVLVGRAAPGFLAARLRALREVTLASVFVKRSHDGIVAWVVGVPL